MELLVESHVSKMEVAQDQMAQNLIFSMNSHKIGHHHHCLTGYQVGHPTCSHSKGNVERYGTRMY